ncbi:MAG: hypothetical protein FJY20_12290 [Bacteroidetes bacterium]|nr:hypothetical protein [Bacteroidota bacterium]
MKKVLLLTLVSGFMAGSSLAQKFPLSKCTTLVGEAMFGAREDTVKSRGMADNYHTGEPGSELLIKFMPGGSIRLTYSRVFDWIIFSSSLKKEIPSWRPCLAFS